MFVTVIICTRNRASQLCNVLDSFVEMDKPSEDWEMLLVDNGSSDNTQEVINSYKDKLPIRSVIEETPGLSNARNTGVKNATGEYICWTDDDVKVDTKWLVGYVEAFKKYPDAVVFGGVVEPVAETEFPEWWIENAELLEHILATRNLGDEYIPLTIENGNLPYGANFAVRTMEQREEIYDVNLGVSPLIKRLGEESDVIIRLMKKYKNGIWNPHSKVLHFIPQKRLTFEYIATYYQSVGQTAAYLSINSKYNFIRDISGKYKIAGKPIWIYKNYIVTLIKYKSYNFLKKQNKALELLLENNFYKGFLSYNQTVGATNANIV